MFSYLDFDIFIMTFFLFVCLFVCLYLVEHEIISPKQQQQQKQKR